MHFFEIFACYFWRIINVIFIFIQIESLKGMWGLQWNHFKKYMYSASNIDQSILMSLCKTKNINFLSICIYCEYLKNSSCLIIIASLILINSKMVTFWPDLKQYYQTYWNSLPLAWNNFSIRRSIPRIKFLRISGWIRPNC